MNQKLDLWEWSQTIQAPNDGFSLTNESMIYEAQAWQRLRQGHNELHLLCSQLCLLCAQLYRANDRLAHLLQRFVPQKVAQELIHSRQSPRPGGEQRQATILFVDARDFTAIAEAAGRGGVLDILNAHLRVISGAVRRHRGTLIQYAGDMVMAAFNVPDDQPHHPLLAARAALDVRDSLERFAAERQAASLPVLRFGIGLNTGPVTAGYLGVEYRYEYAAIGDTTNVAFHLCSKAAAGQILIGQMTLQRLDGRARITPLGSVQLKRRHMPLPVYELVGLVE